MYELLPALTNLFPGSGITPFTIRALPLEWWMTYARMTQDELKRQAQEARRGK